jgi:hypothetical protein
MAGYDLCEACFGTVGRLHPHKMKKYRKTALQNLLELTDHVITVLQDREDLMLVKEREVRDISPPVRDREVQKQLQQQDSR